MTSVLDNATTPNTLTQVEPSQAGTGSRSYVYWVQAVGATTGTYTVTYTAPSTDALFISVMEVSGLTAIDKVGATAGGSSPAAVATSAANTTAFDFVVVVGQSSTVAGASGISNPPSSTDGFAWTSVALLDNLGSATMQASYKLTTSIVTPNATYAWTGTSQFGLAIASFKGTSAAPFAPILLDNASHSGGSDQIGMGSGPNTGTGDTAQVAFTKLKQWAADANTMVTQLYPVRSLQTPVTGFTIAAAAGVTDLVLNPAGALAAGTVTLPAAPGDNQPFGVKTSQTITALTVNTSDGTTLNGAPTTLAANSGAKWRFITSLNKWFREQ